MLLHKRLQTSRPSQGKLARLRALVSEAVAVKGEVPEAAVAAEGARQGLRSRTQECAERESSGVPSAHAAALPLAQETRTRRKRCVFTMPCEVRDHAGSATGYRWLNVFPGWECLTLEGNYNPLDDLPLQFRFRTPLQPH